MRRLSNLVLLVLLALGLAVSTAAQGDAPVGVEKIVYITIDYDLDTYTLFIANPDRSNATPLLVGGMYWSPSVSPDGMQLAFIGRRQLPSGSTAVYAMNLDGTNLRNVTPPPSPARMLPESVVWLPDGRLLYSGRDTGRGARWYTFELDSDEQTRIQFSEMHDERRAYPDASVSPDGRTLAVLGPNIDPNDFSGNGTLYTANIDGTNAVPFPALTAERYTFSTLAWSPDGTQVALTFFGDPPSPLTVANADGSNMAAVSGSVQGVSSPSWSPDGSQLLFVGVDQSVDWMPGGELYVVNADGSNLHSLNVPEEVAHRLGTWWGYIAEDIVLPSAPVDISTAAR